MQNIDAAFDQYEVGWIVDFMDINRPVDYYHRFEFCDHYNDISDIIEAKILLWSDAVMIARGDVDPELEFGNTVAYSDGAVVSDEDNSSDFDERHDAMMIAAMPELDQYEVAWIVDFMEIHHDVGHDFAGFEDHCRTIDSIVKAGIPLWSDAIKIARDNPEYDPDDPYGLGPSYNYYDEMAHDLASDQACDDDYYHDSGDDYDPDFDDE